jgi:multidrug efflux pump subunit AcrA (membrane-fusion protein)
VFALRGSGLAQSNENFVSVIEAHPEAAASPRLSQVDPRPFQATLDQAKGNLAVAQSNQTKADADVKRAIKLFQEKVISDQERDTYINAANSTKASVQAAEAAIRQAEVNLGYTKITAPIGGIVGIATAHVGALVGPGAGPLTTIEEALSITLIILVLIILLFAFDSAGHVRTRRKHNHG